MVRTRNTDEGGEKLRGANDCMVEIIINFNCAEQKIKLSSVLEFAENEMKGKRK